MSNNGIEYTPMEKRIVTIITNDPDIKRRNSATLDQIVEAYYAKRERPLKPRNTIATVLRNIAIKSKMLGPPFVTRSSKLGVNSKKEGRKAEYSVIFVK
jgi:hypothetical protein